MFFVSIAIYIYTIKNFSKYNLFGKIITITPPLIYVLLFVYEWQYFDWIDYEVYEEMNAYKNLSADTSNVVTTHIQNGFTFGAEIYFIFGVCILCLFALNLKKDLN
jgi:hypothetical protein